MKTRQVILGSLFVLIALLAVPVARGLWFYRDLPPRRSVPTPDLSTITMSEPPAGTFVDQPTPTRGTVLLDWAHDNMVSADEVAVLVAHLNARGLEVRDLAPGEDLVTALHAASAFVTIAPLAPFSEAEVAAIEDLVERGGRLLLVGDPTRFNVDWDEYSEYPDILSSARFLNDLAAPFDLTFEEDYLYNVVEHEGNYQNILLQAFADHALTEGLSQVGFYATHSIRSPGGGLIVADDNTHSSVNELGEDLAVAALGGEGQVLALGDLTFMTNPYAGVLDNDRLVANIADFVAGAERRYGLAEFPHFFGPEVDLIVVDGEEADRLGTAHIVAGSELQQIFERSDRQLAVRGEEDAGRDTLFVGFLADFAEVDPYLDAAGVEVQVERDEEDEEIVTTTLEVATAGEVDATGMALLYHHQEAGRQVLILLADAEEELELSLDALAQGDLSGCLEVSETLALCAVGEGGGWDEGDGANGGEDGGDGDEDGGDGAAGNNILIVADDDAELDCFSSAEYYDFILYQEYEVDLWYEYSQGNPSLDDLTAYDAVIWSTGNCSSTAPAEEDAEMLRHYVAEGGRLLIEGMRIGADWSGTDFYAEVCHAEATGIAPMADLEVADAGHPLAAGFDEGETFLFLDFLVDMEFDPDVIAALEDADVVFVRGPDSEEAGAPAILAYEGEETRVVYLAFPLFLMAEEDMEPLIMNAAAWLLGE